MTIRSLAASGLARPGSLVRAPRRSTHALPGEVLRLCPAPHPSIAAAAAPRVSRRRHCSSQAVPASDLLFGQPLPDTHPHLLAPGDLTPGISAAEYHARRAALAALLPAGALALLPAATVKWRSGAVFYPFRQESNFLYLTGFAEPDALAVIHNTGHGFAFHLYARPKDPALEQWSGPWSGLAAARDVFNADVVGPIADAAPLLAPLLRSASAIYADADAPAPALSALFAAAAAAAAPVPARRPAALAPLLNALRVVKSPAELAALRHAGAASGRALTAAMRRAWPTERALAAHLAHALAAAPGLAGAAYEPVVAGGRRARLIHYVQNAQALRAGELVLVDAGGERGAYAADITRTWPVAGRFAPPQRDLYAAVLAVQRRAVARCRADRGASLDDVHRAAEADLRAELRALGFDVSAPRAVAELFPHHVGHYVGLDVHDCPGYGRGVPLKKGMCVTVEPGVYVPDDDERWPKHFRGMGIRIEDSVAVDDEGPVVLSVEAVKEVEDIEALRS